MEFQGCPKEIVNVIRALYERSTISIRITGDGDLAKRFSQLRGIRQGSSLSPCLFVLAMDYCLRVFQVACTEMGLPSHDATWTAYADDIADKSTSEWEATEALQQLEAASAFVGLRLNVAKTECMAKGIVKPRPKKEKGTPVSKQRVAVTYDNVIAQGWMVQFNSAHLIGIQCEMEDVSKMDTPVVILYDDGEFIVADDRGGGWIRDQDGDSHRIKRLGFENIIEGKEKGKFVCEACQSSFDSAAGLKSHNRGKWCRKFEDMSIAEQVRLRRTRQVATTRKGKTARLVEEVSVRTCEEQETKSCGEFVYLGSKIITSASATPEIRRRIGMAFTTFGSLHRTWKSKSLSRKTKAALYVAIILSIMLYNAEVWPIKAHDIKALEGAHIRMMRSMMASRDRNEHISNAQLFEAFKLPTIRDYITYKRLSWVGHAVRRGQNDRSRIAVLKALSNRRSTWTKAICDDCRILGIKVNDINLLVENRDSWRKLISVRLKFNSELKG